MQQVLWEGDTAHGHYKVVDGQYGGRVSRVLYSGDYQAAQSGVAQDDNPDLLFDYMQRLLELAGGIAPKSVLILGGGVGTLARALLDGLPKVGVDMVEPDRGLTRLAYDFFDLPVDDRLRLFHVDGRTFLREHSERYDMIVVDAFYHTIIPQDLKTVESFRAYYKHLRPKGVLAMNVISGYYGPSALVLQQICASASVVFGYTELFLAGRDYSLWLPQNFIFTAHNQTTAQLARYTRGELMQPPETSPGIALHDTA